MCVIDAFVETNLSRRCFDQPIFRFLQKGNDLPPCHGWEAFEKIINRFAGFEASSVCTGTLVPWNTAAPPMMSRLLEMAGCLMPTGYSSIGRTRNGAVTGFVQSEIARWGELVQQVGIAGTE
jgi:hypothetical protein